MMPRRKRPTFGVGGAGRPYGSRSGQGFGRLAIGGLTAAVLLVAIIFACGKAFGGSCSSQLCPTDEDIAAPEGYEFVSKVYRPNPDKPGLESGNTASIKLPLLQETSDSRNLSFHRYDPASKSWQPVIPAVLQPGGEDVSGTFKEIPAYLAVVRRQSKVGHVAAYLPHNGTLHSDAAGRVTIVHTLDFKPNGEGKLDGDLSAIARDGSFQFIPTVSANQGKENGALAAAGAILSSAQGRTTHVQEILKRVEDEKLDGIDIAYLDLSPDQRTSFRLLISELAQALHSQGKLLTLTLPVPQRNRDVIDEGAYDWQALGQQADVVQLVPYRDQSDYRLVVPRMLEYLAGRVEPSKLVLTVSPLATEKSAEGLRTMPIVDAMRIATRMTIRTGGAAKVLTESNYEVAGVNIDKAANRSGIAWSPETASVFFTYEETGGRTVYIENVLSIGFKLEYIPRYSLGGVAIDDASQDDLLGNIWPALNTFIATGRPTLVQPNSADLAPRWNKSGGDLDGGQRGVVKWRTPATPAGYTISLTLSEGVALFENELTVTVEARDPRTPAAGVPAPSPTPAR